MELGGLGEIFTTVGRLFVSGIASLICYKMESSNDLLTMPYISALLCFVIDLFIEKLLDDLLYNIKCYYGNLWNVS